MFGAKSAYRISRALSLAAFLATAVGAEDGLVFSDPKGELVDSLDAAIALGMSLDQYDMIGEYNSSSEYGDELTEIEIRRFRFVKSLESEVVVWAAENRTTNMLTGSKPLSFQGTVIEGKSVTIKNSGPSEPRHIAFPSFKFAYERALLPDPGYWGLGLFPPTGRKTDVLKLKERVLSESATVAAARTTTGLKFVMTYPVSAVHVDNKSFHFGLPDLNPTYLRVDRSYKGGPHRMVMEQTLVWDEVLGRLRPTQLFGSIGLVRQVDDATRHGRRFFDLQVAWLPYRKDLGTPKFSNELDIKGFIDEGFKLAEAEKATGR